VYDKWLEKQGDVSPISTEGKRLLEQCRVKKKTLASHEGRVLKLKSKVGDLVEKYKKASDDQELKKDVDNFFSTWDNVLKR
jgi:hypothetical protein